MSNIYKCRIYILVYKTKGEIHILENVLDLIYPRVCGICGKVNTKALCNRCETKMKKEFKFKTDNYEADIDKNFIEHNYFFKYENLIRTQIISLKFHEKPYIYQTITYFLKKMKKSFENLKKYDIIITVPLSMQREKERGYNQSMLVAKEISKIIEVPIESRILYKIKNTIPQSSLNKEERRKNAKGVYKITNIEKIQNKKILLIDDIYTTGNTVNECAYMFMHNGTEKKDIGVLTIAKD